MGEAEQMYDPSPVPCVWRQQLQHPGVIASRLACQRPRDGVGKVIVTNGHGICVTSGGSESQRGRPWSDTGKRCQPAKRVGWSHFCGFLHARGSARSPNDRLGPFPFNAKRMEILVTHARQTFRTWLHPRFDGAWCPLTESIQNL